jgi:hypothetical protein
MYRTPSRRQKPRRCGRPVEVEIRITLGTMPLMRMELCLYCAEHEERAYRDRPGVHIAVRRIA